MTKLMVIVGGATAAAVLIAVILGALGRSVPDRAFAIVTPPTNTPGPTPTPLPGDLYGLWDIEVGPGVFHCIARTDQDPVSLALTATAQCYAESGTEFTGAEPPCDAAYATGVTPTPAVSVCGGQVAPPPYTNRPSVMFAGSYNPLTYTVSYTGCFADGGGTLRPNVIVQFSALGAAITTNVYANQTNTNCDHSPPTPSGSYTSYSTTMTGVNPQRDFDGDGCKDAVELWSGRPGGSTTCGDDPYNPLDSTTLTSASSVEGDYSMVASLERQDACVNHTWQHQGEPGEFNCTGMTDGTFVPGAYISCSAWVSYDSPPVGANTPTPTPAPGNYALKAKALCTFDVNRLVIAGAPQPAQVVNPSAAGGTPTCPTAPADMCGDGSPGAPPPGCIDLPALSLGCANTLPNASNVVTGSGHCAAINKGPGLFYAVTITCHPERWLFNQVNSPTTKQAMLTGGIDTANNLLSLQGCLVDQNTNKAWGNVYLKIKVNAHTGVGLIDIYRNQPSTPAPPAPPATCNPTGTPLLAPLVITRQASSSSTPYNVANWDTDGDGCNDAHELTDTPAGAEGGGLRDPSNRWDFFDPFKEASPPGGLRKHNAPDMAIVLQHFGANEWIKDPANQVNPPVLNDGIVNPNIKAYSPTLDRTVIPGSNVWNLTAGDGYINAHDLLAVQLSFGHTCPQTVPANP